MDQHKNFASSLVATAPSPATTGTSLVVTTGDGVKFPTAPFNATIRPALTSPTTANAEVVRVTARATDTLTIVRTQENSTARTVVVGDVISATITTKAFTDIENAFGTQSFRGLYLRSHADKDVAPFQVEVIQLDELVMNDGSRYAMTASGFLPFAADVRNANGATGIDIGTVQVSTWYEIYAIGKSTTQATADVHLMFHRAKDYLKDTSFETPFDASQQLRIATATPTDKVAQGFQLATAGKVEFVDVTLVRSNAVTGQAWFTIEADSAGNPSGTPLATSDKFDLPFLTSAQFNYIRFPFRVPATLSATTQYHLVLQANYTKSDTANISWAGVAAGGYANGAAKRFNGSVWSTIAGLGDFQFRIFVTRNDTAVTMPSGYDQSCKLGYVFNQASGGLYGFIQRDRFAKIMTPGGVVSTSSANPVLTDASATLPPGSLKVHASSFNPTATTNCAFGGVPDGYSTLTLSSANGAGGSLATTATTNSIATLLPFFTEYQAVYMVTNAGTFTPIISAYEW